MYVTGMEECYTFMAKNIKKYIIHHFCIIHANKYQHNKQLSP